LGEKADDLEVELTNFAVEDAVENTVAVVEEDFVSCFAGNVNRVVV